MPLAPSGVSGPGAVAVGLSCALLSYAPTTPNPGIPCAMNGTWSVRPRVSSCTGEYSAMSPGWYAGTTLPDSIGFSSGSEKLYLTPRSWKAIATSSASAARKCWTAGRFAWIAACAVASYTGFGNCSGDALMFVYQGCGPNDVCVVPPDTPGTPARSGPCWPQGCSGPGVPEE